MVAVQARWDKLDLLLESHALMVKEQVCFIPYHRATVGYHSYHRLPYWRSFLLPVQRGLIILGASDESRGAEPHRCLPAGASQCVI